VISVVRPWTDQDDSDLLDFDDNGRSLSEAAAHLRRGETDCASRLEQLKARATCRCAGIGCVCENHPDRPWAKPGEYPNACDCGAGDPCPACNALSSRDQPPISRPASRSITTKTARGTRKGAERRARRLFFAYRPTACAAGSSDERRFTMSGATTVGGSSVTRSFSPRGVISNMRRRQQQCRDNLSATPARGICISCHAGSVPHIAQSTLALALQMFS